MKMFFSLVQIARIYKPEVPDINLTLYQLEHIIGDNLRMKPVRV